MPDLATLLAEREKTLAGSAFAEEDLGQAEAELATHQQGRRHIRGPGEAVALDGPNGDQLAS